MFHRRHRSASASSVGQRSLHLTSTRRSRILALQRQSRNIRLTLYGITEADDPGCWRGCNSRCTGISCQQIFNEPVLSCSCSCSSDNVPDAHTRWPSADETNGSAFIVKRGSTRIAAIREQWIDD